jgi:hypothetical protein
MRFEMVRFSPSVSDRQVTKAVLLGAITLALYALLFLLEGPVLRLSAQGGWFFLIPVTIAFTFSLAHGTFTGYFWDVFGVKAKK